MKRELTADFAKVVAQTAIGQTLHSHFGVADEIPSLFHGLLERMDREDARRVAARYPIKTIPVQNHAASVDTHSTDGVIGECAAAIISSDEYRRRAAALLARAQEARTAADTMQAPGNRVSMLRIATTYEKIAGSMIKSTNAPKDPKREIS